MSAEGEKRPAFGHKRAEMVVAALFFLLGAIAVWDSVRLGARWADDGPQAGYFPFYIGLIMFIASVVTFVANLASTAGGSASFVDRTQLKQVLQVLIPTIVFVILIGFIGIYLASAIFIAFFMSWLGKYAFYKIVPIAIVVPLFLFLMFEIWFLVPLPKGPIETALGY